MNNNFSREQLLSGKTIQVRPHGNSMRPKINSGDLITISPDISDLESGDIVFCKVKGNYYVHLITAVRDDQFQISNNKGHVNGWVTRNSIYGKVTEVNP